MEKFIATTRDINSKNLGAFESELAAKVNLKRGTNRGASGNYNAMAKVPNSRAMANRYNNNILN